MSELHVEQSKLDTSKNPIRLSREQYHEVLNTQEPEETALKYGIPLDTIATVEVEGRIFKIVTSPNDFGTSAPEEKKF
jgi:hypothetical protein